MATFSASDVAFTGFQLVRERPKVVATWAMVQFAVSMAFNFLGYPVGAAIAGALASSSMESAIWLGVGACALAAVFAAVMVPRQVEAIDSA